MLLAQLQQLIGGIYDVHVAYDVYDFLVTDPAQLPGAARGQVTTDEQLIVAQPAAAVAGEGGESEVALALYLDPALLERLAQRDPLQRLDAANVADCWTALEGVSHFLYLAWNAGYDRPVSLLELEMQAEVDKYVATYWLLRRQSPGHLPLELRHVLFERTRVDAQLAGARVDLYREASRYAGRFCRRIEALLSEPRQRRSSGVARETLAELRRFYRLGSLRKRAYIERL
ncbi:MAG: hypothetical protein JSR67_01925 [Proteobacteria bacterium]|nr:hypothetical protein [Pseudomonadota bacterium]